MEHEVQFHHHEWWCDAPHSKEPSIQVFRSEDEFSNHLHTIHDGSFTEFHLPFLMARGKRPSLFPFKTCPFCKTPEFDISKIDDVYKMIGNEHEYLKISKELQKHIGIHLRNLSMWALLEPEEKEEEMDTNTVEVQSSGSKLSSIALEFDEELIQRESQGLSEQEVMNSDVPQLEIEVEWDVKQIISPDQDPVLATFREKQFSQASRFGNENEKILEWLG